MYHIYKHMAYTRKKNKTNKRKYGGSAAEILKPVEKQKLKNRTTNLRPSPPGTKRPDLATSQFRTRQYWKNGQPGSRDASNGSREVKHQYDNIIKKTSNMIGLIDNGDAVTVTKNETQNKLLVLDNERAQSLSQELSEALKALGPIKGGRKTKKMLKNKRKGGKTSKRGLAKKKKNQSKRKKK